MKRFLILFIAVSILPAGVVRPAESQSVADKNPSPAAEERGLVALDQTLRELANPYTVMCVAARPADADYGTLAYYRKKLGARTVIVFATRGEQTDADLLGESEREAGIIRTREALEAARVAGADVYFLNLKDFGHSKSAEEALSIWGRDDALQRLIAAIRSLRPDVIITNHNSRSGDGQQQAIARLTGEAFDLAADAKQASVAGMESWQAARLFRASDAATVNSVLVRLNEYDYARGQTYAEIERNARRRLASSGTLSLPHEIESTTRYYTLALSAAGESLAPGRGLLDGIPLPENLSRSLRPPMVGDATAIEAIANRERLVESLREKLIEKRAEGSLENLRERYGVQFFRVVRFTEAIERAIALALGLDLGIRVSDRRIVAGQKVTGRVALRNGSSQSFPVAFHLPEQVASAGGKPQYKMTDAVELAPGAVVAKEIEYDTLKDAPPTLPHLAHLYDEQYYPTGSALPGAVPSEAFGHSFVAIAEVGFGQVTFTIAAMARFDVAPAVEISTIPFAIVEDWSEQREIEFPVRVRNHTAGPLTGALWIVQLALVEDNYEPVRITFTREDEEVEIKMRLRLPVLKPPLAPDVLIEFRRERPAPPDPLGSAKIVVKAIEHEVSDGLKAGYVRGIGSRLGFALMLLGVEHKELRVEEIKSLSHGSDADKTSGACADLASFDTIIIDERAYFIRPELMAANECLLSYAEKGGNVIVMSQQPDDLGMLFSRSKLAPFQVTLSRDRITSESAPVKVLDEAHLLMSKPNQITAKDFEMWTTERAFNVPRQWASEYTPLIETADAGEEANRGSLLVARHGEGFYIFVSLALRRQILEMNAGAIRLFANLVSLRKTRSASGETK